MQNAQMVTVFFFISCHSEDEENNRQVVWRHRANNADGHTHNTIRVNQ